ncbi:MAG TPA: CoF synthetase [Candidatus Riflebacteria bacterium]|jgi:phenylacetate-CoA ligase|nr:CoF synthetase [Candidatus Riflebacteria bacterium]
MMKPVALLSDSERFPLLSDLSFLKELRQDSCAPMFNFGSGDRLTEEKLAKVQQYSEQMKLQKFWPKGGLPEWLPSYLAWCRSSVPAYRAYEDSFLSAPSICRSDIANAPWRFVSDECNVDDMLVYNTSGSTGAPMDVIFDPVSQAAWIPQLEAILAADGISLAAGAGRVSICLVCMQESTLTYVSLSTYLRGAGILKINLNPADWNSPEDRNRYLEKHDPEVLTGDPFTFLALASLAPVIHPKALVSSAMSLGAGLRSRLEKQFGCPVYDIYSLTECRMIGVSKSPGIYRLIRPELYVEILHPDNDTPVIDGGRGEITVTGGINPFLPLIRYRTGDYGCLRHSADAIEICEFEGRPPTVFLAADGGFVNNVDVSRAMGEFALAGFSLHQRKDRSLEFTGWGEGAVEADINRVLADLFGRSLTCKVTLYAQCTSDDKKVRYSSEFSEEDICL